MDVNDEQLSVVNARVGLITLASKQFTHVCL